LLLIILGGTEAHRKIQGAIAQQYVQKMASGICMYTGWKTHDQRKGIKAVTDEPYYVDDPFEDQKVDLSDSGVIHIEILKEAQKVCRRPVNPFQSPKEKNRWLKIDKQYDKGIISKAWIDNCFDWAREKNKERHAIVMGALISTILNKARMTDFHAKMEEDRGLPTISKHDPAQDGF
jgi:hypothetical protein